MINYANIPAENECIEHGYSVRHIAESILELKTYDTALPQEWVNQCADRGFDPRGRFVMCYDEEGAFGRLVPLTREAALSCPFDLLV